MSRTQDSILAEKQLEFQRGPYQEVGEQDSSIKLLTAFVGYLRNEDFDPSYLQIFESLPHMRLEKQKHMCASLVVACAMELEGEEPVMGIDGIYNHQAYCPRLLQEQITGKEVGYDACQDEEICNQPGHGEVVTLKHFLESKGFLNEENYHEILRPNSRSEKNPMGIISVHKFIHFLQRNSHIIAYFQTIKHRLKISLYGQKICCEGCKSVFAAAGLADLPIHVAEKTYHYERNIRRKALPHMSNPQFTHQQSGTSTGAIALQIEI